MEPNYHNMQFVILDKRFTDQTLQPGSVIAFHCDTLNAVLVKRIAAVPGQTVSVKLNTLLINDIPSPLYEKGSFQYAGILSETLALKEGEYIVIGDNISESKDSRYQEVGIVSYDSIVGKVVF